MEKKKKISSIKPDLSFKLASLMVLTKVKKKPVSSRITTLIDLNDNQSIKPLRVNTAQNFRLIWLDSNIDESTNEFKTTLNQFRRIVNKIDVFTNTDSCIDFLSQIKDEKVLMIVSGTLGQFIIPIIHHISQLNSIYVFCENQSKHESWAKEWPKVKGIFVDIDNICIIMQTDTQQCDRDMISISVTNDDLNRLDPSFMYTQLLKKYFLEMNYDDDDAKKEFTDFCREQYHDNPFELEIIDEFEHDCGVHTPIWWYTRECFLYKMLNRALRIQDVEIIIKMGFFIRNVHCHIQEIYLQTNYQEPFTVYRGQGMSMSDFEKIKKGKGRLLAFNNFLSTSLNRNISLSFAKGSLCMPDFVGILFQMMITPSIPSSPFASVTDISAFSNEQEILFSMHAVFRICEIEQIEDRLWRIDLTLTSDSDQELKILTDHIEKEIQASNGCHRIGELLLRMGNFENAEDAFEKLREGTNEDDLENLAYIYNQLGRIKNSTAQYREALEIYTKLIEIQEKSLSPDHPNFTTTYNDIGDVYANMGEYAKALEFYKKSLETAQKYLPSDHPTLGATYDNIGEVYENMGEYVNALEFHKKSLDIQKKTLPPNHPQLGATYNNIGEVHANLGQYSKALEYYEKSLEIQRKSLPSNHPELATTYHDIAAVHDDMGEYSEALNFYKKSLDIRKQSLPADHPELASTYDNIGEVYENMGEYMKALGFHQKSLEIQQKSLPSNHPELGATYNNIGEVYVQMGQYTNALECYQKSLDIQKSSLPLNHPEFATTYHNIAAVSDDMGEYTKALEFYQKALEIRQKTLPSNHPDIGATYNNIGEVYANMGDYTKALEFHRKSLDIQQKSLLPNHPDFGATYNNIGEVYIRMKDYSKALEYHYKSLKIGQRSLPPNHPELATTYYNIANVYEDMGQYSDAMTFHERALEIRRQCLPLDHPDFGISFNSLGKVYAKMEDYTKALECYEKSLHIQEKSLPTNHPDFAATYSNIGQVYCKMGDDSTALTYYEHAVNIAQSTLSENHPRLQHYRNRLAEIQNNTVLII